MKLVYTYIIIGLSRLFCEAQTDTVHVYRVEEDTTKIKIVKLNINSDKADFSPVLINNTLLFSSARTNNIGILYSNGKTSMELTDLFSADKKDSLTFKNVNSLSKLNTKYNEGPFTLSGDGNTIFYTGNEERASGKNLQPNLLKIYYSEKVNGSWGKPKVVSFCEKTFSYCHPSLSSDKATLFFCSDMPGGYGGMDIYITKYENNQWTNPVNLGSKINTPGNELFPFISSQQNILYFSSTKTNGLGGLDIYSLNMNDPLDNNVVALDYPVNSVYDDFGIWTDSSGTSGYFSTNRINNNDDIYYFTTRIPDLKEAETPVFKNKFCYTFYEETAFEANDTASLSYEWDFGDGFKSKELSSRHCFTKPGNYTVTLNAIEKSTGEVFANQLTYSLTIEDPPKLSINCSDTIFAGSVVDFNSEKCALKGYTLNKVYWCFGDGKYNTGTYVRHTYFKPGKYTIQLGTTAKNNLTGKAELFKIDKQVTIIERK